MAFVRNKRTGEIQEVPDNEVQNYLSTPAQSPEPMLQDNTSAVQQPVTQQQTTQTQTPIQPQDSAVKPIHYITGHSLDEHRIALEKARAKNDTGWIKRIEKDFETEYKYQTDTGGIKKAEEIDKATKVKGDVITFAKQLQDLIAKKDQYSPEEYASAKNSLASNIILKKKEAENLGAAFSGNELAILSGQVPVTQEIGGSFPQRVGAFFTGKKPVQRGEVIESDEELDRKMALLIAGLEGREVDPSIFSTNKKEEGMGVVDAVTGFVKDNVVDPINNYGKDAGTGIRMRMEQGNLEELEKQAKSWEDQAYATENMEDRKVFLQNANQIRAQISAEAGDISKNFSEDVNMNPALRGLETAAAITSVAELPALAMGGGTLVKQAVTHPFQSAKAVTGGVKQAVTHPVQTAKTMLKEDLAATGQNLPFNKSTAFGARLPDENLSMANGAAAIDETGMAPTPPGSEIPAGTPPTTKTPADLPFREKMAKEFATSVAVPNPDSVTKSEKIMEEAFKMTNGNNPRQIARELELDIPKAGNAIRTHAANLDAKIGLQSTDEIVDQIMERVSKDLGGRANRAQLPAYREEIKAMLEAGDMGQEAMAQGAISGTNFEKLNDTRMYLTSNKEGWFAAGRPVGTPAHDLASMDWAAANAIKDIMSEADAEGIFKQMLHRQHISFEAAPVLSRATLKRSKVTGIGGAVRRGIDTFKDRAGLKVVERGTNTIPEVSPLTMDDGTPPISGESALLENTAPETTFRQSSPQSDPFKGKRFVNTNETRFVKDAKGKVIGMEKKTPDGKWVPYKSSTKNFKQAPTESKKK